MPDKKVIKRNIEEISRSLAPGGTAKIQLRGIPVHKKSWYYGPSFDVNAVKKLIEGTSLTLLKTQDEGERYFWIWLSKES